MASHHDIMLFIKVRTIIVIHELFVYAYTQIGLAFSTQAL